jgi:hypothetical protein
MKCCQMLIFTDSYVKCLQMLKVTGNYSMENVAKLREMFLKVNIKGLSHQFEMG